MGKKESRFTRRFLVTLLVPPFIITMPLAALFLSAVIQLSSRELIQVAALGAAVYVAACAAIILRVRPVANQVQRVTGSGEGTRALSACQNVTIWTGPIALLAGVVVFALSASLLTFGGSSGLTHFASAGLVVVGPATLWIYAVSKQLLRIKAHRLGGEYDGRRYSLAFKYAIAVVGLLLVSSVALLQLVISRVSTELERLAIAGLEETFDDVASRVDALPLLTQRKLRGVSRALPPDVSLFWVSPDGTVLAADPDRPLPDPRDLQNISRIGTGDSTSYFAPSIALFRKISGDAIVVATVPWSRYQDSLRAITLLSLIPSILTLLLFGGVTWSLSRDVSIPLRRLQSFAGKMAEGDFSDRIAVYSDDEIGALAHDFEGTRRQLDRLIAQIGSAGHTITSGVRQLQEGTRSLVERSAEQSAVLAESSDSLERVRSGAHGVMDASDTLSQRSEEVTVAAEELTASARSVAAQMDSLADSLTSLTSAVQQMSASSESVNGQSDEVGQITRRVYTLIQQMSAEIAQLNQASGRTSELSDKVRELATTGRDRVVATSEGVSESLRSIRDTAAVVDDLGSHVQEIGVILSVINDITEQTDLLSLNAAIIAAQAGEHGAGFAVVAGEIRQLAQRTRDSTSDIKRIIDTVQDGSEQAVKSIHDGVERVATTTKLAEEASHALDTILDAAAESSQMSERIAATVVEETLAVEELEGEGQKLESSVREITRSITEQVHASNQISKDAERMTEISIEVKRATDQQSGAADGITRAMIETHEETERLRKLLRQQLEESESISKASKTMLAIASANEKMASDFGTAITTVAESGRSFDDAVGRFRLEKAS